MSSIHVNRAQSANPRSIRRSATTIQASHIEQHPTTSMGTHQPDTNVLKLPAWRTLDPSGSSGIINNDHRSATTVQASHIEQRPTTSMGTHQPDTNVLKLPAWRTLDPSGPSGIINSDRRPKTSDTGTTTNTQSPAEQLYSDEIESLLRCLDRDDKLTVKVDCLANYRKLIQTIDLRQTPLDQKSLCALQQRENRIVQRNACRDRRFHSLLDILEPSHAIGVKHNNLHSITYNHVSEL